MRRYLIIIYLLIIGCSSTKQSSFEEHQNKLPVAICSITDLSDNPLERFGLIHHLDFAPIYHISDSVGIAKSILDPSGNSKISVASFKYYDTVTFDSLFTNHGDTIRLEAKIDTSKKRPLSISTTEILDWNYNGDLDSIFKPLYIDLGHISMLDSNTAINFMVKQIPMFYDGWFKRSFYYMGYNYQYPEIGEAFLNYFDKTSQHKEKSYYIDDLINTLKILILQDPKELKKVLYNKYYLWKNTTDSLKVKLDQRPLNEKLSDRFTSKNWLLRHKYNGCRKNTIAMGIVLQKLDQGFKDDEYLSDISDFWINVGNVKKRYRELESSYSKKQNTYNDTTIILKQDILSIKDLVNYDPNKNIFESHIFKKLGMKYYLINYPIVYHENKGLISITGGFWGIKYLFEIIDRNTIKVSQIETRIS